MGETWLVQSYTTFVQNASPNDVEIVRDCQLTLTVRTGTLATMPVLLQGMMTTTMMTATPKRVAAASP